MAVTIRSIIEKHILDSEEKEIDVDYLEELTKYEIDRIDIVKSLQQMEDSNVGVFMKGRRGKKSRFIKGMSRAKNSINEAALEQLRAKINELEQGETMLVSLSDCEEKATEEQIKELEEYKNKVYASQFFDNNTAKTVDALKILQQEGLGSFIIGRRGKFSRFIKGVSKEELQNRPKGLMPKDETQSIIEIKDPKYIVVNNIILRTPAENGLLSLEEAVEHVGCDLETAAKSLFSFGYFIANA